MDGDKIKEVKGSETFKVPDIEFEFFLHESEEPWRLDKVDITEKSTGLRLCTLETTVAKITIKDAIEEAKKCIQENTLIEMVKKIDSTKKLEERTNAK